MNFQVNKQGSTCTERLKHVRERRARAGKMIAGTAAASTSEMFKGQVTSYLPMFLAASLIP